ncbi:hypothetical protein LYSHEL_24190 [Lysobacter helvus]|uniref:FimV N-terminal domain-containing protein n=2 Tax=Lysobacteraceae TaxID=32033 RepID=A0ABM7Q7M8_9GAMM|nr:MULTISPECIES: FimV/HubP family polar landmark protein [Lysobacter]BCT93395.1 hypothetical protein LYSCAS_24190 [Lysobacter caseinilyticus]BCT96548.1 hypothetical protein LYSHEL_24190 [Lysobacter helvus]
MRVARMSKPLRTALGIALLALSGQAAALGLGQIQVKSRVDQPLLAEIPIVSSDPAELEQLQARLASPDTFRRIGLDPPTGVAADLQFTVALDSRGRPVIRVTSSQPVTQPLVTFLVEVDWGSGQLVREYSALLDTPRTVAAPAQPPIQAPTVAQPNIVERPVAAAPVPPPEPAPAEPAPTEATQPPPEAAPPEPAPADTTAIAPTPAPEPALAPVEAPAPPAPAASPDSIAVNAGSTLSQLAAPLATRGYTLDQAMLALLRANPDAFVRGNINLLKAGTVLRVPPAQDVATLSASEAAVVVRDHLSQWRAMSAPAPQPAAVADTGNEKNNAATSTTRATPRVSQARLEIVPPTTGAKTPGSRSGASAGGEGDMLRQELQQTKETLAAKDAEVADLKARVAELEKLQQDQAALLQMKDSKLAAAEQQLAKANTAAPATTVAKAQATQSPPAPQPASTPAWVWGGAGLIVLGLLAWVFSRRRRAPAEPVLPRRAYDTEAMAAGMPKTAPDDDLVDDAFDLEPDAPPAPPPPAFSEPAPRPGPSHWTSAPATLGNAPTWHAGGGGVAAPVAPAVTDPVTPAQQLELARAYLDMGDDDAARVVLREVMDGRDPAAREAAARLLRDL